MNRYGIKSKRVVQIIIKRSALGFNWYPGHPGGNLPYLNPEKENRLLHFIKRASEHQECLYSSEVIYLAYAMRKEMIVDAKFWRTRDLKAKATYNWYQKTLKINNSC